jgi:hypothetical protein
MYLHPECPHCPYPLKDAPGTRQSCDQTWKPFGNFCVQAMGQMWRIASRICADINAHALIVPKTKSPTQGPVTFLTQSLVMH